MATPPTLVATYQSVHNTTTSPKTVSVTRNSGDVLVVHAHSESAGGAFGNPTLNGVTFTLQQAQGSGSSNAKITVWTGTATTTETSDLSMTSSTQAWGIVVYRYSGSDGIGATSGGNNATASGAPSLALTTTGANSAIVGAVSDWNAVDGASRTWRTINSITPTNGNGLERAYAFSSGAYTMYSAHWNDSGATGSKTTGLTAPSTMRWVAVAVEVLGSAGAAPAQGTAAVTMPIAVAATGARKSQGSANVGLPIAVAATGGRKSQGNAALGLAIAVTAAGDAPDIVGGSGTAALGLSVAVDATGSTPKRGSVDVGLGIAVAGTGRTARQGSAAVGLTLTVAAHGIAPGGPGQGSANVGFNIAVAGTGARPSRGSAGVGFSILVTASGNAPTVDTNEGFADVGITFDVFAQGAAVTRLIPVRVLTPEEILTGNRSTTFLLDILDSNDNRVRTLDGMVDGDLDWVANAMVKGAGSLKVRDVGQSVNWLTVRLRPIMLVKGLPAQPLGVFLASEAPESYDRGRFWSIKLLDKTTILDQDTVASTYALPAGAVVTTEVKDLIESAGILNHAITTNVATLSNALVWEAGTSKLRIINDLLSSINYFSLYANFEGQLIAEPYTLPAQRPIIYEFVDGDKSIYDPRFARDVDIWKIPNRVTAVRMGDGVNPPLSSTLDNTDPFSPYSIPSRGRVIGHVENGVEAADQATLDALVRRMLVEKTTPTASVQIKHAPVPGLSVNQAVRFRRVPAGIDHRHVVSKTTIKLRGNALATSTFREVVDL